MGRVDRCPVPSRWAWFRPWMVGVAALIVLLPLARTRLRATATAASPGTEQIIPAATPSTSVARAGQWPTFAPAFVDSMRAGAVAYEDGEYEPAITHYRQAVRGRPDDANALNNLAQVLARTGHPDQAIPLLDRAVDLAPQRWAFRFNRAHAQGQVQNWKQAVEDYRAAAFLFPDDYATRYNLGLALRQIGDEPAAVSALELAVQLAPSEPSFVLSLADGYIKVGRRQEAVDLYRRFLETFPEAPAGQRQQVATQIAVLTVDRPGGDRR